MSQDTTHAQKRQREVDADSTPREVCLQAQKRPKIEPRDSPETKPQVDEDEDDTDDEKMEKIANEYVPPKDAGVKIGSADITIEGIDAERAFQHVRNAKDIRAIWEDKAATGRCCIIDFSDVSFPQDDLEMNRRSTALLVALTRIFRDTNLAQPAIHNSSLIHSPSRKDAYAEYNQFFPTLIIFPKRWQATYMIKKRYFATQEASFSTWSVFIPPARYLFTLTSPNLVTTEADKRDVINAIVTALSERDGMHAAALYGDRLDPNDGVVLDTQQLLAKLLKSL